MAPNGLFCADVPLRNYSLTHCIVYVLVRVQGLLNDRRTMLGEMNWIFTAITDTIAWNVLSRGLSESSHCFDAAAKRCRTFFSVL